MAHEFTKVGTSCIALLLFTILIQVMAKELTDEQKEQLFADIKRCVNKTNLPNDELERIIAKKELPTSKEGKCFTKCLMEKMEYMVDGKINPIAMDAALEENMENEGKLPKAKEIIRQCMDSGPPEDSCEYAYSFSACIYNKMKNVSIKQHIFL